MYIFTQGFWIQNSEWLTAKRTDWYKSAYEIYQIQIGLTVELFCVVYKIGRSFNIKKSSAKRKEWACKKRFNAALKCFFSLMKILMISLWALFENTKGW